MPARCLSYLLPLAPRPLPRFSFHDIQLDWIDQHALLSQALDGPVDLGRLSGQFHVHPAGRLPNVGATIGMPMVVNWPSKRKMLPEIKVFFAK